MSEGVKDWLQIAATITAGLIFIVLIFPGLLWLIGLSVDWWWSR